MTLRKLSSYIAVGTLLIVFGLALTAFRIEQNRVAGVTADQQRQVAARLGDTVRQSSEDLSRMARLYVVTREQRYADYYRRILAIRRGEAPRPDNYDTYYWYQVELGAINPDAGGTRKSINALMREANLDDKATTLLASAVAASDQLSELEQAMIDTVRMRSDGGRYPVDTSRELARLTDEDYASARIRIMSKLSEFSDEVNRQFQREQARISAQGRQLWYAQLLMFGAALALLAATTFSFLRRVLSPLMEMSAFSRAIAGRNYDRRLRITRKDELGLLAETFNNMADAIESDISRQEKSRALLTEARDAAEAASRAKGDFLANMSHEIRTPLNAILGMSELALDTKLDARQRRYIKRVHDAARNLLHILNDILDFSKIEAGRMELELIPFSIAELVDQVQGLLEAPANDKGITLLTEIGDSVPGHVISDPHRINQVLVNLAGNAIKFTENGKVAISVKAKMRGSSRCELHFSVLDTGIGIDPSRIDSLFESFTQADSSTTRRFGGTGLGLAISRRLVEMMGGRIWAESEPGLGSDFQFTLPVEIATAGMHEQQNTTLPAVGSLQGLKVLLAEDNEINQEVACEILKRAGVNVHVVETGLQAIQAVNEVSYDAILMDCQMPEMDGFDATRQIRSNPRHRHLPIIAMTANALSEDRDRCLEAGMDDHLAKPVDIHLLLSTLGRWVGSAAATEHSEAAAVDAPVASPSDNQALLETLQNIPGLNAQDGLARVNNDAAAYLRLLGMFARNQTHSARQLRRLSVNGQPELLQNLAHQIKGVSANLGLQDIHLASSKLESVARESKDQASPPKELKKAAQALARLLEHSLPTIRSVTAARGTEPVAVTAGLDPRKMLQDLEKIAELIADADTEALGLARQLVETAGSHLDQPGFSDRLNALLNQLAAYDFEAAALSCEKIVQQLRGSE